MMKTVVYTLLTAVFLYLIVVSPTSQKGPTNLQPGRRLGYEHAAFDPLVLKMERRAEETKFVEGKFSEGSSLKESGINPFPDKVDEMYEYFSDEGRLNITLRLIILFPMLDKAPKDGVISFNELKDWNIQQATDRLVYRTQKELASHDKDGDGSISFREYLPKFSDEDIGKFEIEKNGMAHGEAGWWNEQFINADNDRNGSLSFAEFKNFLHPEDCNNEKILQWLLREKIKRMDNDNDGKLNYVEFHERAYDIYKNYLEFESSGTNVPKPEEKFAELDLNKDRLLTEEELKPILRYLQPGELSYAIYYTKYLIHEADDNGDGKLTLEEMLNHEYIFYSTVFEESKYDDDDDDLRDEL